MIFMCDAETALHDGITADECRRSGFLKYSLSIIESLIAELIAYRVAWWILWRNSENGRLLTASKAPPSALDVLTVLESDVALKPEEVSAASAACFEGLRGEEATIGGAEGEIGGRLPGEVQVVGGADIAI